MQYCRVDLVCFEQIFLQLLHFVQLVTTEVMTQFREQLLELRLLTNVNKLVFSEYFLSLFLIATNNVVEANLEIAFFVMLFQSLWSDASAITAFDSIWCSINPIFLLFVAPRFWSWISDALFVFHVYIYSLLWSIIRGNMHSCWLLLFLLLILKWHLRTITLVVY